MLCEPREPIDRRPQTPSRAGHGAVELRCVGGRTVVTRVWACSPLKLLNPRASGSGAWIFSSTLGGGLVAGDDIALDMSVGPGCSCLLGTQSVTKVYRSADGRDSGQMLNVALGNDAICVVAPHPVTCFAHSRFVQRQRIEMRSSSSLVLIDWLTSGRHAAGERWAFDRYDSRTDVLIDGRHVFRDAMLLSNDSGPIDAPHRTGGFDCFAYAVVLGDAFGSGAQASLQRIQQEPIATDPNAPLIFAGSPLRDGGAVFRAAGAGSEIVGRWLLEQLSFVGQTPGCRSWSRMLG